MIKRVNFNYCSNFLNIASKKFFKNISNGHLVSVDGGVTARYFYDYEMRRRKVVYTDRTILYFYDLEGKLISEKELSTGYWKDYIYIDLEPIARIDQRQPWVKIGDSYLRADKTGGKVHLDWSLYGGPENFRIYYTINDFTFSNPSVLQETPNKTYDHNVLNDGNNYAYRIYKNVPTEGLFFYHTDHLMTPLQMTDENQNIVWQAEYYPFGRIYSFSAEIENNLRFPGQYADFSVSKANLYYNFFRWYKNNIGRYIRTDINVYFSFIIDENVYAYAKGNSINIYDFYGLSSAAHICCDGKGGFTICWDQNIPEGIIKKCIEEHEKDHINYMERNNPCTCKNKPPKEKRFTMEKSKYNEMECSGYRVEYCCIERNWPFIPDKAEALKRKIKLQNEAKKFNCPKDNWKCQK